MPVTYDDYTYFAILRGPTLIVAYHGSADHYSRQMQVLVDERRVYPPPFSSVSWEESRWVQHNLFLWGAFLICVTGSASVPNRGCPVIFSVMQKSCARYPAPDAEQKPPE